jgi:predicted nucleic acid-binding protein
MSKKILLNVVTGKLKACTSVLTWDEVVYIVKRNFDKKTAVKEGNLLISFPNLHFFSVTERELLQSQAFIEKYNVQPRDALHAACMITNNITEIISYDSDFDAIKEISRIAPE